MKFKVSIIFVFFVFSLLPGISLAQNKVVVIPLVSDSDNDIQTVTSAGQVWMDRNLGAYRVAQSIDDYQAYGWLYQWGRLSDGHEIPHSTTTTDLSGDDVPGHGDFIIISQPALPPYDWKSPQNDNLWQGVSGVNNPCPPGFRLPTATEWEIEINSWSSKNSAGAFASPLKLVVAGSRSFNGGMVNPGGSYGYYWGSTVSDISVRPLYFHSGYAGVSLTYRAAGFSVRCIKN